MVARDVVVDDVLLIVVDAPCPVTPGDMNRRGMDTNMMRRMVAVRFMKNDVY
jgi:hypothetical protein